MSSTAIANMALSHIGHGSIETLDEDSAEANACKTWYDHSRRQSLEAHDWNFARKRQTLALHSEAAPSGVWAYRYQYPSGCLKIRSLVNPLGATADAVPYEVELDGAGKTMCLLTDLAEAVAVFTFDLTTTALFSPAYIDVLSYLLAHRIAMPITTDARIENAKLEMYLYLLQVATVGNDNEQVQPPARDAEVIRARN